MSVGVVSIWRERAELIVAGLTLEEKASLTSGADFWNTKGIDRVGLEPFMLTDGPHGLRKQNEAADHLGLNASVPATCFPTGAGLAATWNPALLREIGAALGREARAENVGILLGPAINIKRHPLGGRSFEYFSEDPELTGELAAAYIEGVQSEGVGTSLKHYAVNNQEANRLIVDAIVDERSLREIYLRAFEIAVTRAQPWTVMSAYNQVNGVYASDNSWLLTTVLRDEWGHHGAVVSDWGAEDDRIAGIRAGLSLEMPGNGGIGDREIIAAVNEGTLPEAKLDEEAVRLVMLHLAVTEQRDRAVAIDHDAHHILARRAATEAAVLLKNDGLLPVARDAHVAVLGAFADTPRYQGGGSSHINPTRLDTLLNAFATEHPSMQVVFEPGYHIGQAQPDEDLLARAADAARAADVVIVLIGLTDHEESEGYDRTHLRLSASHTALVETAQAANENVVVVLSNGAPVEMPWADRVPAILETYLAGQASGSALANILTGVTEPTGRLAETFPARIHDTPAFLNWPGTRERAEYREGIFVGYRYYDTNGRTPLFPFGHGLGYTDIAITNVQLDREETARVATPIAATVTATNRGTRSGTQVVQVYVHQQGAQPTRPEQELKAFTKITLAPGESRDVTLMLDERAFAYWGVNGNTWVVDDAGFEIRVGTSSRNIAATATVTVHGDGDVIAQRGRNTALGELFEHPALGPWAQHQRDVFISNRGEQDPASPEYLLLDAFSREFPLRSLVRIDNQITQTELDRVLRVLDGYADPDDLAALRATDALA